MGCMDSPLQAVYLAPVKIEVNLNTMRFVSNVDKLFGTIWIKGLDKNGKYFRVISVSFSYKNLYRTIKVKS